MQEPPGTAASALDLHGGGRNGRGMCLVQRPGVGCGRLHRVWEQKCSPRIFKGSSRCCACRSLNNTPSRFRWLEQGP